MAETRKLAAILAADVVGYSRLAGADEERTLARLRALRSDLIDPTIAVHHGRVVKRTGDGTLVEFRSVVDAVRCAIEVQNGMVERNAGLPPERKIEFRVGIHLGDVVEESDGDLMGDGVNIAARIEAIADPGGISLSYAAYEQVRDKVAQNFVDRGEQSLKNIARPTRVYALARAAAPATGAAPAAPATPAAAAMRIQEKPSIAVLPFQNMSGDPEQEHFCDGLVEDIITTLSKLAGLRVIARNSSFVYKGRSVDVREAAKQLGVRYILEGSVRKSGNRIRVTSQLIDASDGTHLWAERYDRSIDDIFAIQDEIALILATEMQVKLTDGEQARLRYTTTHNVEAWTCWVQGLSYYRQALNKENSTAARQWWEKALALDPNSGVLNAMLGFLHNADARFGWWDDRKTAIGKTRAYIERALAIDPNIADAYITLGFLSIWKDAYEEAAPQARKAVELAPGSADILNRASFVLSLAGYPEEAVALGEKSLALNPNYPPVYLGILGNSYRLARRFDEAIATFERANARSPGLGLVDLVIAYAESGQAEKSKDAAARLMAARRDFTIESWRKTQFRHDKARLEMDTAALRATGLA